ncbi:alanine--glyoxylate aminotransferase-like [Oppia nitens]|uniref:alanine--glyoxylate aminotransferase-like n=1 Tax=Oppia nitens TaxID=1686743 RepID=UPI0023DAECF0|nr:alanine--glyoxylate aminotransferase-like [Oppia nitens]
MSVEKPDCLQNKFEVQKKLLMSAGMANMSARVRAAMICPLLPHSDPQLHRILTEIADGIRYTFQTNNRHTFAISGPACLAFETAISNLLEPGSKILVVVHGVDGERLAETSKNLNYKLIRLNVPKAGELVELTFIENTLTQYKPKVLFLCHGDTSSGTLQPLRGIGALCHKNDCLFMVDVSATLCCAPIAMDQMNIDVMISDTQYALGLSPGLSLMSFNSQAVNVIEKRDNNRISYSMNFNRLIQSWGQSEDRQFVYHYTPSVSLLYALRESLAQVVEEGLDKMIARHIKFSVIAQKEFTKIGLKFVVEDENKRLTSVLVIQVPDQIKRDAIIDYLYKHYDIVISAGVPPLDQVWRIGFFGQNASRSPVKILTTVFKEAIDVALRNPKNKPSLSTPSVLQ